MATAPELVNSPKGAAAAAAIEIRTMRDDDVVAVAAVERASYQFPWSEGIFRDCVRVGYLCRVVECSGVVIGHGIVSTPRVGELNAGEAWRHVLSPVPGEQDCAELVARVARQRSQAVLVAMLLVTQGVRLPFGVVLVLQRTP